MAEALHLVAHQSGLRLDKYLSQQCPHLSRSSIQKLIKEGYILVNDCATKANLKLKEGERISIITPPPTLTTLAPEDIPLSIVHEDGDLMVIDKPAGLTVHPAPGHPSHTLVNALLSHCPELAKVNGSLRPGIVHRLDKDTSGLMVIAKNDAAKLSLTEQLRNRAMAKRYLLLVQGHLSPASATIDAPIGRHPHYRKYMAVTSEGKKAQTQYKVKRLLRGYTLVEAALITGRTHQLRVHFSAIGYPVAGDAVYGVKVSFLPRQFVHACYLGFHSPSTGKFLEFTSALPADLLQAIEYVSPDLD